MSRKLLFVLSLGILPGCFFRNGAATAGYHAEVSTVSLRVAQAEASLTDAESRLEQIEEALRIQGEQKVTQLESLEDVVGELARLRGEVELVARSVDTLQSDFDAVELAAERRRLHLELRMAQVEEMFGLEPPPLPSDEELGLQAVSADSSEAEPSEVPIPEASPESEAGPETPEDYLERAAQLVQRGANKGARKLLEVGLSRHAEAPEAAEMHYRIAETHLNDGEHARSIKKFQAVVDGYGRSPWAAWSILRQAEAFEAMGQSDNARLFFEEVVTRYPDSEAASQAKSLRDD